jgi:hypothetical protein
MCDHGVLYDIAETLKFVLWNGIEGTELDASLSASSEFAVVAEDDIILASPDSTDEIKDKVKVFIFQVREAPEMRNLPPELTADFVDTGPPMYLIIDFMIIPSYDNLDVNLVIAGKVLQIFYDRPVIRGPMLRGDLAGTDAELRVVLNPLSLDDLTKLWSSFPDTEFQFSLYYRIYNVPIRSLRAEEVTPVVVDEKRYVEFDEEG